MNKRYNYSALALFALALLSSCIDHDYDLDKDISMDVLIAKDSIAFPVGNTEKVLLSDIIKESDFLKADENGQYYFSKSDDIDPVSVSIDPVTVTVDDINTDPVELSFRPTGTVPIDPTIKMSMSDAVYMSTTVDINQEVPDELVEVKTIEFKQTVPINISLNFEGFPATVDDITLEDFIVSLPSFITFNDPSVTYDGDSCYVTINDSFNPHNGYSINLNATGMDFSGMTGGTLTVSDDHYLVVNEHNKIAVGGQLNAELSLNDFVDMGDATIVPVFTMPTMQVAKIAGRFDLNPDPISESFQIELDDDGILSDGASFDLTNPQLLLTIGNTIGVPVDFEMQIHREDDNGNTVAGSEVSVPKQTIQKAETDGEITESNFIFSKLGTSLDGYLPVQVSNFSDLFQDFSADQIVLTADLSTSDNQDLRQVDLTKPMEVTGHYEMAVPLTFTSIDINYKDTIEDILGDLDFTDEANNVSAILGLTVLNGIPLNLSLDVIPLDAEQNVLSGITVSQSQSIAASVNESTASSTAVDISLTSSNSELEELNALVIQVSANAQSADEAGVSLNANQYIQFSSITFTIKGGVVLDLND